MPTTVFGTVIEAPDTFYQLLHSFIDFTLKLEFLLLRDDVLTSFLILKPNWDIWSIKIILQIYITMILVLSASSETFYKSWNGQNSNDSNVIGVTCVDSCFGTLYHSVTFDHEGQFGQYKTQNQCFRPNYIHGINVGANGSLLWSLKQQNIIIQWHLDWYRSWCLL